MVHRGDKIMKHNKQLKKEKLFLTIKTVFDTIFLIIACYLVKSFGLNIVTVMLLVISVVTISIDIDKAIYLHGENKRGGKHGLH